MPTAAHRSWGDNMWGGKPLAILLILSMLSACAGARAPDSMVNDDDHGSGEAGPTAYDPLVEARVAEVADSDRLLLERSAAPSRIRSRAVHAREPHHHEAPSPTDRYAAEVAFLITAQLFVCSFVVVILDGHCSFYASTGYPYYY